MGKGASQRVNASDHDKKPSNNEESGPARGRSKRRGRALANDASRAVRDGRESMKLAKEGKENGYKAQGKEGRNGGRKRAYEPH
jgi:hypothetical protein